MNKRKKSALSILAACLALGIGSAQAFTVD